MERTERLKAFRTYDRDELTRMYPDDPMLTVKEAAAELQMADDTLRRRLYRSATGSIRLATANGGYIAPLSEWIKLGDHRPRGPKPKRTAE